MLIFAPIVSKGVAPITLDFTATATSGTDTSSYTYSSQSIGAATPDRLVAVATATSGSTGSDVSSLTVGGISATQVVRATTTDGTDCEIWSAAVPTGTTADVVVNFTSSQKRCGIGVYRLTGASSTATNTYTDTSTGTTATSVSADIVAGGGAIAVISRANPSTTTTTTWAGLTERYNAEIEAVRDHSGASNEFVAAQTGLTISATPDASMNYQSMAVAAFGPA